jgi:hypothetical protein
MSGRLSGPLLSGLLLLLPLIWSRNPSVSRDEGPQQVDGDGENNLMFAGFEINCNLQFCNLLIMFIKLGVMFFKLRNDSVSDIFSNIMYFLGHLAGKVLWQKNQVIKAQKNQQKAVIQRKMFVRHERRYRITPMGQEASMDEGRRFWGSLFAILLR